MKAIIFDLDGTITNSDYLHFITFNKALSSYNIRLTKSEWKKYKGQGSEEIFERILMQRKIENADIIEMVRLRSRYFHDAVVAGELPVVKGFKRFYGMLKKRNVKVIIATSSQRSNTITELESIGLKEQDFVCAQDVEDLKPFPDIFLLAAKKLDEKPENCIVFEDSESGIKAAKLAGMHVIGVKEYSEDYEVAKADQIIKNYTFFSQKNIEELIGAE